MGRYLDLDDVHCCFEGKGDDLIRIVRDHHGMQDLDLQELFEVLRVMEVGKGACAITTRIVASHIEEFHATGRVPLYVARCLIN